MRANDPLQILIDQLPPREESGSGVDERIEIVHALRESVEHWGPDVTMQQFLKETGVTEHAVYKHWSSWSELRVEAGLEARRTAEVVHSDEELLAEAVRVIDECGGFPTIREFNVLSRYPYHALYMRFGRRSDILAACEEYRRREPGPPDEGLVGA